MLLSVVYASHAVVDRFSLAAQSKFELHAVQLVLNDNNSDFVLQMHAVQIHTNVVGGMTMTEPANDLAIAVSIASSYFEQPIARDIVCIAEVGECLLPSAFLLQLVA